MPAYTGKVFSFEHDWSTPVIERIGWLTDVLRKRDGSEQRIRVRQKPRHTLEYTGLIGGVDETDQRRRFDALMWTGQDQEIMIPYWQDATELTSQLNSGASALTLPQGVTGYNYATGTYIMFWRDYRTYEVVKITTINQGTGVLTFDTNTTVTWTKGTRIMPAWLGLHDPISTAEIWATDIKTTVARFEIRTPTTAPTSHFRAVSPTLDTYRSTKVFNLPGLDGSNQFSLERSMQRIDFSAGQFENDSIQLAPFGAIDCNLQPNGRTEIAALFGWFNERVGRQKAFWLPTYERDFENVEKDAIEDDVFTAASFAYSTTYNLAESRRDIVFMEQDGTMLYRRLILCEDDGTTETFQVDSALPDPLPTLDRVSFLRFCRLDQDEVELSWQTTEDLSVALKLRELIKTA